ncbi:MULTISPECIES: CBS domain-containing protein [unclassified Streptomyces]|uniref:CBS domain-containing protein n=1 Tax=unclassified Streptomyces TaxID=2593676 RepID=UPI000F447146|nr:CBS domain-containing protein [Streptomyces sp. I6]RNL70088.1 CBS domain-containing protein [Streptomyces sp. I6]
MKHSKVGSLMVGDVVTVVPSTPFKEVAKRLAEHDISGLPVLDEDDRVVGVVSETDLLARQAAAAGSGPAAPASRDGTGALPGGDRDTLTAGRLMSSPAVTVHAEETIAEAARTMLRRGVERMPVVDEENRLVGIVTRRDLLQVFLRPDSEIRLKVIEDVLVAAMGLPPDAIDVHVVDGRVTLEGRLEAARQVPVLVKLTEQMDGVVSVSQHLAAPCDGSPQTGLPSGGRPHTPERRDG